MNDKVKDTVVKAFSGLHNALYRATGGKIGSRFRGVPTALLTTTGRKSGKARTNPVLYLEDGDRKVLVASYGGDDRNPTWFLNLTANPEVTLQIGPTTHRMKAEVAGPEERARLWPKLVEMYSDYGNYQKKTDREIPVVILTPA
jgi:deazaflavin-dependent oxidoreductase (nitroreductase family)